MDVTVPSEQVCYILCNFCNIVLAVYLSSENSASLMSCFFSSFIDKEKSCLNQSSLGENFQGRHFISLTWCVCNYYEAQNKMLMVICMRTSLVLLDIQPVAYDLLMVSVPSRSLFDIVTVRCGHCTNLWSVDMAAAFQSLSCQDHVVQTPSYLAQEHGMDSTGSSSRFMANKLSMRAAAASNVSQERTPNRPPGKRQRETSAYNQFIKEEIQRIKANNPDISHREAFSTAAKNWAHFPHIHFGLMLESNNESKLDNATSKHMRTRAALLKK